MILKKPAFTLLSALFIVLFSYPIIAEKVFVTEDAIYEPTIKTAQLYPTDYMDTAVTYMDLPPLISLTQTQLLRLKFDEIGSEFQNYFIKIINCNADWTVSNLNSIQYLNEYNEYQISDKKLSYNTRMTYVHYEIFLPKVRVSGNYIVLVYRNGDDTDIILSKRFLVFEEQLGLTMEAKFPVTVADRNTGQQIDFTINFSEVNVINPMQNLKIVLRQNYRWDNAKKNLKPSFFNEATNTMEYYFYNNESTFKGLNEFRYLNISSNRFKGVHVAKVTYDANKTDVVLTDDFSRSSQPYSYVFDLMNGRYITQNYESGDTDIQPDYVFVTFVLNSPKIEDKVYIVGGLNDFKINPGYEMVYNTAINKYTCSTLLKQGQYNYDYITKAANSNSTNEAYFEGSFNVTQNVYDLIVYYRPLGAISDQIIGYKSVNYQGR